MTALIVRRGRMVTEGVPMAHLQASVERAMKVQEVIVRALAGQLTWLQATDILGRSPAVSAACGGGSSTVAMTACSIVDGGPRRPSAPPSPRSSGCSRSTATATQAFNVRHFHQLDRRQHGVRRWRKACGSSQMRLGTAQTLMAAPQSLNEKLRTLQGRPVDTGEETAATPPTVSNPRPLQNCPV